ncbi:unnamed protein product [Rotaria sp. Silwood1]|nr:unnamed protein product [Rotaria sp. Silwood1]CAF3394303.1 unnamed protein product [Rotaria sp. Silwood1]CAF4641837.1 unnamed protein product [Rotaria sp. Silwood1]CAF4644569.1 unnamed protein product [Rotaria sp. Silwood1]
MSDNNLINYCLDKNHIRIDYTTLTPRFSVTNNDSLNDGITHLNEHENIPGRHIQRHDSTTWSNNWPGNTQFGIINECGIGQSDFMWNFHLMVVEFFVIDIMNQNGKQRWDGFIALTDHNETTGGLIVFPHTHLRFSELNDLAHRGNAIGKFIHCQSDDPVLWDFRLVHCNSCAFVSDERLKNQSIDFLRIVAYVSMSPTTFISNQTLDQFRKKRKLLAQNNCTLTHWSTELTEASSTFNLPKISLEKLDAYQRALIIGTNLDDE